MGQVGPAGPYSTRGNILPSWDDQGRQRTVINPSPLLTTLPAPALTSSSPTAHVPIAAPSPASVRCPSLTAKLKARHLPPPFYRAQPHLASAPRLNKKGHRAVATQVCRKRASERGSHVRACPGSFLCT